MTSTLGLSDRRHRNALQGAPKHDSDTDWNVFRRRGPPYLTRRGRTTPSLASCYPTAPAVRQGRLRMSASRLYCLSRHSRLVSLAVQLLGSFGQIYREMLDQFLPAFRVLDDAALDQKGVSHRAEPLLQRSPPTLRCRAVNRRMRAPTIIRSLRYSHFPLVAASVTADSAKRLDDYILPVNPMR